MKTLGKRCQTASARLWTEEQCENDYFEEQVEVEITCGAHAQAV